ncbi:MAG TPA: YeeE/YedE family protein [Nevskiaceae bacterium]|nr:YeeE/YedE family protein [Nevskiaceae bacterium]
MDAHQALVALAGGLLIGIAVDVYLLGTGRIAGISGVFGTVITGRGDGVHLAFLAGLIASPWLALLLGVHLHTFSGPAVNWLKLVAAGLLVGVGTQVGSGCTSGHGVCGLANLSPRSLVATITFMGIAGIVVALGFGGLA